MKTRVAEQRVIMEEMKVRHAQLLRHVDPGFLAYLEKKQDIILDDELLGEE